MSNKSLITSYLNFYVGRFMPQKYFRVVNEIMHRLKINIYCTRYYYHNEMRTSQMTIDLTPCYYQFRSLFVQLFVATLRKPVFINIQSVKVRFAPFIAQTKQLFSKLYAVSWNLLLMTCNYITKKIF